MIDCLDKFILLGLQKKPLIQALWIEVGYQVEIYLSSFKYQPFTLYLDLFVYILYICTVT